MLLSGPITNTLENTERAASSLLCGAEVAANQTRELLQRATMPLSSMLDRIREISSNAYSVAGRVQKFIHALTDSVHHVAGEVFCIIPSYVASHLKKRLAAPVVTAFEQMKREFNFNLSASANFELDTNISRSLQQTSQEIMKEISSELQLFQKLIDLLKYAGLFLLALSFLRAMHYRRRYLRELSFDNIYIGGPFEELDRQVASLGGEQVLPITRREAQNYIAPLAFRLTDREWQVVMVGVVSVFRHLVMGGVLVALDFLVFWMLDQVNHQVKGNVVARAPVTLEVQVNGSGYASDIYRDLVAAFNTLQGGNITVISRKCLLVPSEPEYSTCFILGFLLGLALLVSLTGGFVERCRRLICAVYHPERELERIQFLRQQILEQRRTVGKALRRSAARSRADRGIGGGEGRRLRSLLLRLPGGVYLSHLLGLSPSVTCLACGEVLNSEKNNTVKCDVPQCTGLYCRPCFLSLGNTCAVCVQPLTSQEDGEEELGSSDDEQLCWNSTQLRKRRSSTATHRRPTKRSGSGVTTKDGADRGESDSSGDIDVQSELRWDTTQPVFILLLFTKPNLV
ncbi:DC-STAMP domain-containing protein 2 [Channa argus]|uniref:DC-STAMP domain-containing protein 2 n=1 Tax=Channa argus TaxID=215402 RepID=A0A6G1PQP9_CHAAH|nr:DC-STAMP domain-containing protein 2 [Channa argus]